MLVYAEDEQSAIDALAKLPVEHRSKVLMCVPFHPDMTKYTEARAVLTLFDGKDNKERMRLLVQKAAKAGSQLQVLKSTPMF